LVYVDPAEAATPLSSPVASNRVDHSVFGHASKPRRKAATFRLLIGVDTTINIHQSLLNQILDFQMAGKFLTEARLDSSLDFRVMLNQEALERGAIARDGELQELPRSFWIDGHLPFQEIANETCGKVCPAAMGLLSAGTGAPARNRGLERKKTLTQSVCLATSWR
jgi:hypothetical protein